MWSLVKELKGHLGTQDVDVWIIMAPIPIKEWLIQGLELYSKCYRHSEKGYSLGNDIQKSLVRKMRLSWTKMVYSYSLLTRDVGLAVCLGRG